MSTDALASGAAVSTSNEQKILNIARTFISETYPALDTTGIKTIVVEQDRMWMVTYELPTEKTSEGRPAAVSYPVIFIDKKTFDVYKGYEEQ